MIFAPFNFAQGHAKMHAKTVYSIYFIYPELAHRAIKMPPLQGC